ncbi:MAG: hypothetical protein KGJ59_05610 [Bacteroidota bacterium]|nr:hypothetical protein [Bacteroidota bacterium]
MYDILGREVSTLVNERKAPGKYEVSFNASKFSSGMYFYVLCAGSYYAVHEMVLTK